MCKRAQECINISICQTKRWRHFVSQSPTAGPQSWPEKRKWVSLSLFILWTTSKVKQHLMTPLNEVRHRGRSGGGETREWQAKRRKIGCRLKKLRLAILESFKLSLLSLWGICVEVAQGSRRPSFFSHWTLLIIGKMLLWYCSFKNYILALSDKGIDFHYYLLEQ